jgi:lipoate-protein ligase A
MNRVIVSENGDGFFNLAMDEYTLELHRAGELGGVTLYFYVNENAVIIGRNQNAWRECDTESMERLGVQLVRRHTGGGAVYHDKGNLNFSFIADERVYDKERQNRVVLSALSSLGITAELSGRNDILVSGRKISGCAYALSGTARGMHGTVLVNTDMTMLSRCLRPSKLKLRAKGISSVRSRVMNLTDEYPVTTESVRDAVIEAFRSEYGDCGEPIFVRSADDAVRAYNGAGNDGRAVSLNELCVKHGSWEWRMGRSPVFDSMIEGRTDRFEYQLLIKVKNGIVQSYDFYTDSIDPDAADELIGLLDGVRFTEEDIVRALQKGGNAARSIALDISENGEI